MHLTTVLTPLTSVLKPFCWLDEHEKAFVQIKEMLVAEVCYTEARIENPINIIFTDPSLRLMGGLLFHYLEETLRLISLSGKSKQQESQLLLHSLDMVLPLRI